MHNNILNAKYINKCALHFFIVFYGKYRKTFSVEEFAKYLFNPKNSGFKNQATL